MGNGYKSKVAESTNIQNQQIFRINKYSSQGYHTVPLPPLPSDKKPDNGLQWNPLTMTQQEKGTLQCWWATLLQLK